MRKVALLIFLVQIATVTVAIEQGMADQINEFPLFTIDLDKEPEERFKEVAHHFRNPIKKLVRQVVSEMPDFVIQIFEHMTWLWEYSNYEKYREITGIVAAIDKEEVSLSSALLLNSLYELQAWCTSIIAQTANGTIIHSRNLDFPHSNKFRNITYRARFVKGGKEVFEAVMFAGNVGVYTAIKKDAYSISQNQRHPNTREIGLFENLLMLFGGFDEISWLIRGCLEQCDTYECANKYLQTGRINALGYIILAGTKKDQGVVIARNRLNTAHVDALNATAGKWYVVQTNNDHWEDHGCYNRCAAAKAHLEQVGQESIDTSKLREEILEVFPNNNKKTVYNTLYVPSQGYIDTIPLIYGGPTTLDIQEYQIPDKSDEIQGFNFKEKMKLSSPEYISEILSDLASGTWQNMATDFFLTSV